MKHMNQIRLLTLAVATGLFLTTTSLAGSRPSPEPSEAFGKSLADWQELYFRWAFGEVILPLDANGNAVVDGNVVLMPMPNAPGDGTPGTIDVTLNADQNFVLPLWNVLGTSYNDGTPNDPPLPLSVFQSLKLTLKIDGVTVLERKNLKDLMPYYTQFELEPTIPLPDSWSPYSALIWVQGVGFVHSPFAPGNHTITLDAQNTKPVRDGKGDTYIYEYHNTWKVKVAEPE